MRQQCAVWLARQWRQQRRRHRRQSITHPARAAHAYWRPLPCFSVQHPETLARKALPSFSPARRSLLDLALLEPIGAHTPLDLASPALQAPGSEPGPRASLPACRQPSAISQASVTPAPRAPLLFARHPLAMAPRAPLLLALLLATAWAARANPAAVLSFNDQAQQAVRAYGIPSQIASKVRCAANTFSVAGAAPAAVPPPHRQRRASCCCLPFRTP